MESHLNANIIEEEEEKTNNLIFFYYGPGIKFTFFKDYFFYSLKIKEFFFVVVRHYINK